MGRAILTYHSVDDSGSVISVAPRVFRAQMEFLANSSATVVTVSDLIAKEQSNCVAITFDDAFDNFATEAWPVMRGFGLPVTVYVPTGRVAGTNDWDPGDARIPALPLMGWDALERVSSEGVTLGSHTVSHVHLTSISDTMILDELDSSATAIEQHSDTRPSTLAYPYGDVDNRVVTCVARAGYANAVTTDFDHLRPGTNPFLVPRLDAFYFRASETINNWGSPGFHRYVRMRRFGRTLRSLLGGR